MLRSGELYRLADADIYHSQEPSLGTYLAMHAMPQRKHIVTFRDPRLGSDWRTEFRLPTLNPGQVIANWLYEDNRLVRNAVQRADGWFAAAQMLVPKSRTKYGLPRDPEFLPTPVIVPDHVEKSPTPTACFVSRWDKRKRPEIFFELARQFPQVQFLAAGKSRNPKWDQYLREHYAGLPNLNMLGFIDQFQSDALAQILGQSWILVNTAAREGLPNSFIEAAAYRCAILSAVDPDQFTSQFGYLVQQDDFATGLSTLLEKKLWLTRAATGQAYVREVFGMDHAIDQHLAIYQRLLAK
jgi:glycosyltransferase involved in cell wall biosynthesis